MSAASPPPRPGLERASATLGTMGAIKNESSVARDSVIVNVWYDRFWPRLCKNARKIVEQEDRPLRTIAMRFSQGLEGSPLPGRISSFCVFTHPGPKAKVAFGRLYCTGTPMHDAGIETLFVSHMVLYGTFETSVPDCPDPIETINGLLVLSICASTPPWNANWWHRLQALLQIA